jgi:VWFA-related protein
MKFKAHLALLLLFCMLLPALAQTLPAPPPVPQKTSDDKDDVVRITTNLVQVDAVVTKDGKAVTNLTADDFEIYQDGKKQTITSFAYVSNVPVATAAPVREKGRDAAPFGKINPNAPHRTVAFVVDDLGLSAESMGQVRRQLRKFIADELQPNDLVAIIRTGGWVGALQQFTNDRRLLNHAVDQLRWNHCSRVGIFQFRPVGIENVGPPCSQNSLANTFRSLRFIIEPMGELPGRKSMVLLSDEVPVETQEYGFSGDSRLTRSSLSGSSDRPASSSQTDSLFNSMSNAGMLRRIAEMAIRASVVIYSVDTQGLAYTGLMASDSFATSDRFRGNSRDITNHINSVLSERSNLMWARREGGDMMARQTGGFQVRNSNSFQLDRIVEDQSGYYLIGYRPTEETFNRRFHHLKAKVKQPGMTLRTRFGFAGVSEEEAKKEPRSTADLTNLALASPFSAQDINVELSSFFTNDKTVGSLVRSFVYIAAKDLQFAVENDRQHASVELHSVIFGDNGMVVEQATRSATLNLSQSDYEYALRNGLQMVFDIPVKRPGSYQVRIAARDRSSSRIGSAGQFVAVPDLTKKKPAVSGIVLGTARDRTGQGLANPGARRFVPNSDLHFAYVLFNAANENGVARNLVMQASLFREGKNIYSAPEAPVTGGDKADPSRFIVTSSVVLAPDLEPGTYYLQVVIKDADSKKKSAPLVQWIEFEVEK